MLWWVRHPRPLLLLFAHLLVSAAVDRDTGRGGQEADRQPLLAPWWRVVEAGDRLLFEHAGEVVELNGKAVRALLPALVPLLDGAHTVREIVGNLGEAVEVPILNALELLDRHGLLVDGPPVEDGDDAASYVAAVCSTAPARARAELERSRVAVLASSSSGGSEVVRLLESAGVATTVTGLCDAPEAADLIVALPASEDVERLHAVNERRLLDRIPWLAVLPSDGRFVGVGPLYVPGQTACHACYRLRRGATSGYEEDFPLLETRPVRAPLPPGAGTVAAGLAVLVCLRWLGARDPRLPGVMYALELHGTLDLTRHRVLRVPRCPACGTRTPPPSPWFRELDAGAV